MSELVTKACLKLDPDAHKRELRVQAYLHEANCPSTSYQQAYERSTKLWTSYEQINRDFFPEDPVYSTTLIGGAVSTTLDSFAYCAAGTGTARVMEVLCGGLRLTASAVNRVALQRSNAFLGAGTTTVNNLGYFSDLSPDPIGRFTTSGSQALQGNPLLLMGFNAFNGAFRWVALPQCEIFVVNGERISFRSKSGTSAMGATMVIEEL